MGLDGWETRASRRVGRNKRRDSVWIVLDGENSGNRCGGICIGRCGKG